MSMLGGLGGGSGGSDYSPQKAPRPPKRADVQNAALKQIQKAASKDSYSTSILGGSAAAPTKSYTSQLFAGGI